MVKKPHKYAIKLAFQYKPTCARQATLIRHLEKLLGRLYLSIKGTDKFPHLQAAVEANMDEHMLAECAKISLPPATLIKKIAERVLMEDVDFR